MGKADAAARVIQPRPHIEALDLFVDVLSQLDEEAAPDEFYNRLCEVICRLGSMERAVMFRYDGARRRVRAAGAHGLDIAEFSDAYITVESAPMAGRALALDQVVEISGDFDRELPPLWADRLTGRHLACTPMAAGGRWVGVVVSDRPPGSPRLTHEERDVLWTLGKIAALAAWSRIATRQSEKAHQLQQRIDMAREIHDGVIQRLFGVGLALSSETPSREELERCAEEVQIALVDAALLVRDLLDHLPQHAGRPPQRWPAVDPPGHLPDRALPAEAREVYDIRDVAAGLVDGGRLLEVPPAGRATSSARSRASTGGRSA